MATLNKVMIIGNLTRDVELRNTQTGKAVATIGIAMNRKFGDKQETTYINVVAWDKLAEICSQHLSKGSSVFIEGRLQSRSYQDKEGNNRTAIEVVAENVQFLNKKEDKRNLYTENSSDEIDGEIIIPGEEEF